MNTREIFVIDDLPPEAVAMLQALYSRDPQSVTAHLERVKQVGPEKFMANYYVGYGHKSIGDCGTTTMFIEQVSMLVAKAIQDWPLYNGQEASTRYLDMSKQAVLNPLGTADGDLIQKEWMALYNEVLAELITYIKTQFAIEAGQKETEYEKAVKAKAFDIARGLLPAGVTTLVSWHSNLRQAYDHLQQLQHHPLAEIREIALATLAKLKEQYPSSFSHKVYPTQEDYIDMYMQELSYFDDPTITTFRAESFLRLDRLAKYKKILSSRPAKTELPTLLRKFGEISFSFPLDFGSFRDLQRHRNGVVMMPLLTTEYGFFPWYLEQLPDSLRKKVTAKLQEQEKRIAALKCTPEIRQYYVAMGYTVTCETTFGLPAAIYVAELRSGQTVHPTLRVIAQKMGRSIAEIVPGIALHCDMDPDKWSLKRGTQDIVKKAA